MAKSARSQITELPPTLARAYRDKPRFSNQLLEAYGDKEYLQFVDDIAVKLVQQGVAGVEGKLIEADNLSKFDSGVAELQIAALLAQNGKKVQLLNDNVWEGPSPDMIASDDSLESYVEVKRMTDDGAANRVSNGAAGASSRFGKAASSGCNTEGWIGCACHDVRRDKRKE